jgi:hypothetical protein
MVEEGWVGEVGRAVKVGREGVRVGRVAVEAVEQRERPSSHIHSLHH